MEARVLVYLEPTDQGGGVWCAESPDVPGFYAAEDHLQQLLTRVEFALREIASEENDDDVTVHWELVGGPDTSSPELAALDQQPDRDRPVGARVVSASKNIPTAA